jgi:hypothetical protein
LEDWKLTLRAALIVHGRSWLDAVGRHAAVQRKLMLHEDIRPTLNIYGNVVTDEMAVVLICSGVSALGTGGESGIRIPSFLASRGEN